MSRLWPLAAGLFVTALDLSLVGMLTPSLAAALDVPTPQTTACLAAYSWALGLCLLPGGYLADRLGRRPLFQAGLLLFAISSALCAVSAQRVALACGRALQGVAAALLQTCAFGLTAGPQQARAVGTLTQAVGLGTLLGPLIVAAFLAADCWRGVFWLNVPLCAVAGLALRRSTAVPTLPYARPAWCALLPSLVPAAAFGFATASVFGLVPLHLLAMGAPASWVGLVSSAAPLGVLLVSPWGARLTSKVGTDQPMLLGGLCMALALCGLACAEGVIAALPATALYGAGAGLFQAPSMLRVLQRLPQQAHALGSACCRSAQTLGIALGSVVAGWVLQTATQDRFVVGWLAAACGLAGVCATLIYTGRSDRDPVRRASSAPQRLRTSRAIGSAAPEGRAPSPSSQTGPA